MALATKIEGVPHSDTDGWIFDGPAWWDAHELRNDPRFRELQINDGYLDYVAVLTPEEAQELAGRYAPRVLDHQKEDAVHLEDHLQHVRWAIIQVYEWESGL